MPNNPAVIPLRFKVYISIETMDGITLLENCPVMHTTLNFTLGGIGTATFIVATGMNAQTREAAAIHEITDKFDSQLLVSCWMETDGWWSARTRWPLKRFRIWEGVTSGLNFTFNRQSLSVQIGSTHWLTRLDNASVTSGNILKGSCDTFTTAFGLEVLKAGNLVASVGALAALVNDKAPKPDFWGDVVKPMLMGLIDEHNGNIRPGPQNWQRTFNLLNSCAGRSNVQQVPEIGNKEATAIIKTRFNDAKNIIPGVLKGDFMTTFRSANIEDSYLTVLAKIIGSRIGSATALEKIYACAQMFMYNIVYNVESATNVPHVPVLKSTNLWRTLNADEYAIVRGTSFTPPEIAGVGVYGQEQLSFNRPADAGAIRPDDQHIIGAFKANDRGKFLMLEAPPFLLPQIQGSANHKNMKKPQSAVGRPTTAKQPAGVNNATNAAIDKLGCQYARLKYYDTVFGMRSAVVSGKLRFDIAPGSMVRIKNAQINLPQFNAPELFATIGSVTVVLDAQDGHAITNFQLSHLRTAKEDDFAPENHPFFPDKPWIGSPLVKIFTDDLTPERG
jgi:hypothetical protein